MPGDVLVQSDGNRLSLACRVQRGELVRVSRGVYVRSGIDAAAAVRREWPTVVGYLHPGAVVTDRSAARLQPDDDGRLYVAVRGRPHTPEHVLPGLVVVARRGLEPQLEDMELPGGIYLASRGRAVVENLLPRRSSHGSPRRTLSEVELGDWLSRIKNPEHIDAARGVAQRIATEIGTEAIAERAAALFDAVTGVRETASPSRLLTARSRGVPYDEDRLASYELAATYLRECTWHHQLLEGEPAVRAFFEGYFSNFIEGTEWTVEEARRIVFEHETPTARPADAHDIRSAFNLINDSGWATETPRDDGDFLELLLERHAILMADRPAAMPGKWKLEPNRVGSRWFVAPDEVEGTLREGFELIASLEDPFARAVLTHWVIVTVHPFNDGNGRSARLAMNAELEAAGCQRIVLPTAWRDDYFSGIRAMDSRGAADALARSLEFPWQWTSTVHWGTLDESEEQIEALNGFLMPDEAREQGKRLLLAAVRSSSSAPARAQRQRVKNRCPRIGRSGEPCKNERWSGQRCRQHNWTAPWG